MNKNGFIEAEGEALIAKAKSLQPLLLRNAPLNEQRGELTEEVIDAVTAADMWRMAVPRRWGGMCISSNAMARVAQELAKGCPSSAWVVGLMNSAVWTASMMSDSVQEEVFANGVPRVCSVGSPPAPARTVKDGYIVTGRWPYASGSHHAEWANLMVAPDDGSGLHMIMLPMRELTLERTWHVAGLKGTGSDTLVAKEVFVPTRLTCPVTDVMYAAATGRKHFGEPCDYWSPLPLLRSKAMGVLVGTIEGLLQTVSEGSKGKPIIQTTYARRMDSPVFQAGIGEAAAKIRTARMLLENTTRAVDTAALAKRALSDSERAANRGETAVAVELMTYSGEKLMNLAGSSAFAETNAAQRYWRDFSIAARHAVHLYEVGYEVYGRALLGVEPNIVLPPFI